jgi:AcrR family transcriptional regulator
MGIKERKARERESRRQEILNTAKELFMIKGLSSTTIEDIGNRAKISAGTTHLYFKNKIGFPQTMGLNISAALKQNFCELEPKYVY